METLKKDKLALEEEYATVQEEISDIIGSGGHIVNRHSEVWVFRQFFAHIQTDADEKIEALLEKMTDLEEKIANIDKILAEHESAKMKKTDELDRKDRDGSMGGSGTAV